MRAKRHCPGSSATATPTGSSPTMPTGASASTTASTACGDLRDRSQGRDPLHAHRSAHGRRSAAESGAPGQAADRPMMRALLLLLVALPCWAQDIEHRAAALEKELRCLVCQN